jgi:hypothetical protein
LFEGVRTTLQLSPIQDWVVTGFREDWGQIGNIGLGRRDRYYHRAESENTKTGRQQNQETNLMPSRNARFFLCVTPCHGMTGPTETA